jgi:outer membrane immunogenic protein
MNKFMLGSAALISLAAIGSAGAADLPVKAPPMVVAPAFSWSGCYLGGNAGGSWQRLNNSLYVVDAPSGYFFPPVCPGVDASGSQNLNSSGFTGGGQIGCNWQSGNWVWGVELDAESIHLNRSVGGQFHYTTNGAPYNLTESASANWMFTARPRVGWAFDHALLYVTGGLAVTKLNFAQNFSEPPFTPIPEAATLSNTKAGWIVGAGWEYAFAPNWTFRGEYLFAQFAADTAIGTLAGGSGSGPGCVAPLSCGATFNNSLSTFNVQIVRAGLNYKFDWGSPVVARY